MSRTRNDHVLDTIGALPMDHPTAHGNLRLRLQDEDGVVVRAEPVVGAVHRGAEKLFVVRDYRQALMLADRHDWLAPFTNELGMALGIEAMLGLPVPERATWLRTLNAELTRISSHLAFLGPFPTALGPLAGVRAEHEAILRLFEAAWGARIHVMANRVGGLAWDVPAGWLDEVVLAMADVRTLAERLMSAVRPDAPTMAGLAGAGALRRQDAASYGVSGPAARASGLDLDLRRDEPYLAYGELFGHGGPGRVVTGVDGDVPARLAVLAEEVIVSVDLVLACVERLRSTVGPVNVRLPKVLRLPEGDVYAATEGPSGLSGYYLVSRGDKTPWRVKMRTASFNNASALAVLLPGTRLDVVAAVVASLALVVGDIDK